MADFNVNAYLYFYSNTGSGDPTNGTSPLATDAQYDDTVHDDPNDGNIDSVDYWFDPSLAYTGWTVTINGNNYAVFGDGGGRFYIPYNSTFYDISGFTDPTQWTFQNTGDNANVANCFLTGTAIATPAGERKVEDLQIGDLILTADGNSIPVKWIGHQSFRNNIINLPLDADRAPICIAKGALGNGLPNADLFVTADHGMIIDGLLVNAGALVNGTTIRRVPLSEMSETFTVYHVETEHHDVILANGAPAESFIDYIDRKTFDNHAEYTALYGDEPLITEMPIPRISSRRQLPADIGARFGISDFGAEVTGQVKAFLAQKQVA